MVLSYRRMTVMFAVVLLYVGAFCFELYVMSEQETTPKQLEPTEKTAEILTTENAYLQNALHTTNKQNKIVIPVAKKISSEENTAPEQKTQQLEQNNGHKQNSEQNVTTNELPKAQIRIGPGNETLAGTIYVVKEKDNLWSISKQFYKGKNNQSIQQGVYRIVRANKWLKNPSKLLVGKALIVPESKDKINLYKNRHKQLVEMENLSTLPTTHQVVMGDTLYNLASLYYGDRKEWLTIWDANPEIDPQGLTEGISLTIPMLSSRK